MIKKDTIVSTTDGRLTLLQWLKKVEAALKNASATAVKGVPQADGKVVFEIDFADGTSIKSDPFELPEKLPDGYAVDGAGNVTINDALHINKDGNTEVNGKAYFCGKDALIYHGSVSTTMEGTAVNVSLTALMMNGPQITVAGEQQGDMGAGMLILASMGNDFMVFLGTPLKFNSDGTTSPATLEDVYNDNWNPYISMDSCKQPIMVGKDGTALIEHIFTNSIVATGEGTPSIDKSFVIDGTASTLGDVEAKATGASQAKYQHTVHITSLSNADKQLNVSFTAMSSKNAYVVSYQKLHEVFGGRNLTISGLIKYWAMGVPIHLDLHGGTISTDKVYFVDSSSAGAYQQPALSEFPNIAFTDDVTTPN